MHSNTYHPLCSMIQYFDEGYAFPPTLCSSLLCSQAPSSDLAILSSASAALLYNSATARNYAQSSYDMVEMRDIPIPYDLAVGPYMYMAQYLPYIHQQAVLSLTKRKTLTSDDRKEIGQYHQDNPRATQDSK